MKRCSKCNINKEKKNFHKKSTSVDGYDNRCKECSSIYHKKFYHDNIEVERIRHRKNGLAFRRNNPDYSKNSKLKMRYGITPDDKKKMLLKQDGQCAICNRNILIKACVDHNHITDEVRGLLCDYCNLGIGSFQENIVNMGKAIQYLKKWYSH